MSQYEYVFFDLDGTLSDSAEGIINAVLYALEAMGQPVYDRERLKQFVGPPLYESFKSCCGFDQVQAELAVKEFRVYYRSKGIHENSMYPGIKELLDTLSSAGKHLVLATSKPEQFAKQILDDYGVTQLFDYVAGSTMDDSRIKKADVIAYAMNSLGLKDPSNIVMVGDRLHDVRGASALGMDCIGVLFGYGSREELLSAGAKYVADTPADVARIILD